MKSQIVEINKSTSLDLGFSYGDLEDPTLQMYKILPLLLTRRMRQPQHGHSMGHRANRWQHSSARIAAAESNGDAKVISRPKLLPLITDKVLIAESPIT
ncbi:MAG: hypothetical protein R2827_13050 [Bdellovibrionales bacterium]